MECPGSQYPRPLVFCHVGRRYPLDVGPAIRLAVLKHLRRPVRLVVRLNLPALFLEIRFLHTHDVFL